MEKGSVTKFDKIEDLSIDSADFPDDLVTENLASILEEQENYEKAISMYDKLILKNPEKKTYFASQIEKLKKLI
ncbi:tetratricopeptide repeat protein [Reichenbachiella versicolor]|uniref:tetratricopeptide repeat protein n=1 Tax=Reichenbachiella versicolor TaxID=1821036 RepID=UPI000D6EA370|nr:tetratricopeptide repeat protein [Reichenbachiella versicolor]